MTQEVLVTTLANQLAQMNSFAANPMTPVSIVAMPVMASETVMMEATKDLRLVQLVSSWFPLYIIWSL